MEVKGRKNFLEVFPLEWCAPFALSLHPAFWNGGGASEQEDEDQTLGMAQK